MFGYVNPHVPELKVAEYEKYRAAYCGLCVCIGKATGQLSRLTLSYDLVFLAAVRMVLENITPEFKPMRCLAHPMNKRAVMLENSALMYAANVSAVLAEEKNRDNHEDEHGMDKLKSVTLQPILGSFAKNAENTLPNDFRTVIREKISRLSELEKQNSSSADETARVFGETLGYVFALGLDGERAELARGIGYHTGHFIYICDAADDLIDDIKKKRYNPLATGWGDFAIDNGKMSDMVRESILTSAPLELEQLGKLVERLDPTHIMTPVIKNTVYLGMVKSLERAVNDEKQKTEKFIK